MKQIIYALFSLVLLLSCEMKSKRENIHQPIVKGSTKLEKLLLLPHDSVMEYYDLSNDSIEAFPDLSAYTIKSLDLSHNQLDTIKSDFLPKGLEKLNLSYNLYCGFLFIGKNAIPTLKDLNISHNALNRIDIGVPLYRINLSYNDLSSIDFNHKNMQYLDISYNSNIPQRVSFEPSWIDTIIRKGVAEGKRLLGHSEGIKID